MKHLNRILSFCTVAFVLVFFGKINKIDLYTAFFRTIQDVEVRNSTGVDQVQVLMSDLLQSSAKVSETPPFSPSFGFFSDFSFEFPALLPDTFSLIHFGESSLQQFLYLLSHPHSIP